MTAPDAAKFDKNGECSGEDTNLATAICPEEVGSDGSCFYCEYCSKLDEDCDCPCCEDCGQYEHNCGCDPEYANDGEFQRGLCPTCGDPAYDCGNREEEDDGIL